MAILFFSIFIINDQLGKYNMKGKIMPIEAIKMPQVRHQLISKLSFKGEESKLMANPEVQSEDTFEKKGMDNSTKYLIGGGSILALIALGILGYKGKLGDDIQKLLGGVKDAVKKGGDAIDGAGKKTEAEMKDAAEKAGDTLDDISKKGKNIKNKPEITLESVADEVTKLGEIKENEKISEALRSVFANIEQLPKPEQTKAIQNFMGVYGDFSNDTKALYSEKDIELIAEKTFPIVKKQKTAGKLTIEEYTKSLTEQLNDAKTKSTGGLSTPKVKITLKSVKDDIKNLDKVKPGKEFSTALEGVFEKIDQLPAKQQETAFKAFFLRLDDLSAECTASLNKKDLQLIFEKCYPPFQKTEEGAKLTEEKFMEYLRNAVEESKVIVNGRKYDAAGNIIIPTVKTISADIINLKKLKGADLSNSLSEVMASIIQLPRSDKWSEAVDLLLNPKNIADLEFLASFAQKDTELMAKTLSLGNKEKYTVGLKKLQNALDTYKVQYESLKGLSEAEIKTAEANMFG